MTDKQLNKWFSNLNLWDKEQIYEYWQGNIDEMY